MTRLVLALVFMVAMPQVGQANSSFSEAQIDRLIVHDSGDILIIFPSSVNSTECGAPADMLKLDGSSPLFDKIYPAILSAFHSRTTVSGWVNGCDGSPLLTRLDLHSD